MLSNNKLLDLINEVCRKKYCNIVITGDFNFSSINWDDMSSTVNLEKQFIDCIQDNYLNQLVKKPTRKRGADRATLLDLRPPTGFRLQKLQKFMIFFYCCYLFTNLFRT